MCSIIPALFLRIEMMTRCIRHNVRNIIDYDHLAVLRGPFGYPEPESLSRSSLTYAKADRTWNLNSLRV